MSRPPFTRVTGPALAIGRQNVDTDMIIRIEKSILAREILGRYALESLGRGEGGDVALDLNSPIFKDAPILLAGDNFGCGSSREAAVWALHGMGIRCVIAPSFGDIFFGNCFQNGLLPIRLGAREIEPLCRQSRSGEPLTVDLMSCVVTGPDGQETAFEVDDILRDMLMTGMDEVDRTLLRDDEIRAWQAMDKARRPWVWQLQDGR